MGARMAAHPRQSVGVLALLLILTGQHSWVLQSASGQALPVTVESGAQLVQLLQTAYASNGNASFLLPSSLSLAGTNYTMLNKTVSGSTQTLSPTNASGIAVLDLAMRPPALLSLEPSVTQYWTNVTFVNGCSEVIAWDPSESNITIESAQNFFFARYPESASRVLDNVVTYVTLAEVLSTVYWIVLLESPFADIKVSASAVLDKLNGTKVMVRSVGPQAIQFTQLQYRNMTGTMVTLQSTADTKQPPQFRLPSVNGGTLMPHQFCNSTALNGDQQMANMALFPIWIQENSEGLQGALVAAANYTSNKQTVDPPPVIFLSGNATMGGETGQFPAVTMRAECVLHGPFNHDPATSKLVSLSLGNRANTVQLALLSKLYISRLLVKDLMLQPLGNLAQDPLGESYPSALPLWGINIASRVNAQVLMDNVTLVVPQSDFAALLAAAQRGSRWKLGSLQTRPIIALIQTFAVSPLETPSYSSLLMTVYQASGVNATNVRFVPVGGSLPANYTLPDMESPPPPAASPSESSNTGLGIGVGVGVGVGGGLLLVAVVGTLLWVRHRRAAAAAAAAQLAMQEAQKRMGKDGTPPGSNARNQQNSKSSSGALGPQSASTTASRGRLPQQGPINVAQLHAAVRANQANASNGSQHPGSNNGVLDPRKAVQQAAGAMGAQDADKLTLLGVLGRGTWGTVYRGLWRNLDVAVKTVLFSDRTDGKGSLPHERAIMEAAVCTSVAHRNVVSTFHYDIKPVQAVEGGDGLQVAMADDSEALLVTEWKLYLVQEWCNTTMGEALRQSLLHNKESHDPQMDLLLTLLSDVVQGVEYLHSKNIIHGDLKPENVMLKMDPSAPIGVVAKITDFGLSTTLGPQATHVSNYNSGTPFYVAPEVLSEGRATKASDIYSFGVLLWEVFNCMPPWIKGKDGAYKPNPRFPHFPPQAPRRFAELTRKCMMRDWRQRPTLVEVIAEVRGMHEAWLDGFDTLEMPVAAAPAEHPTLAKSRTNDLVQEGAAKALSEFVGAKTPEATVLQP